MAHYVPQHLPFPFPKTARMVALWLLKFVLFKEYMICASENFEKETFHIILGPNFIFTAPSYELECQKEFRGNDIFPSNKKHA